LLRVGLTGGIASGKSAIAGIFVSLGAHLLKADELAHELMLPGKPVYEEVVRAFGAGILNADQSINRPKLAQLAFGDATHPPRVEELNKIVHPAVLQAQLRWMDGIGRQHPGAVAMVEAALILEAKAEYQFDRLIVVTCQPEQRIQRMAKRQGISLDAAKREIERRMAAQLSDEEKIKAADYVIDNSGTLETSRQRAREIYAELRRETTLANRPASVHTKR
jgi:dephospho-CoA kinase